MDNLTHTLAALALARAGLDRLAPRASLTLVLAANAPDIDVLAAGWGSLAYLRHHRGVSHSFAGIPVIAGLVVVVVWLLSRRGGASFPWTRAYGLALAGVASHLLMDFSNLYGVRPWLPFSPRWYSWDILFIVDVWLWGILLACLAAPAFGRLISGEIGAPPGSGRAAAVAGLLLVAGWWTARDLAHRRALQMLESHLYAADDQPAAPRRVAAFPDPLNPLAWRGLVELEGFHRLLPVHIGRPLDPSAGQVFYKPDNSAAVEAAAATRTAAEFALFARYRSASVEPLEDGYRVVFRDFRFLDGRRNAFVCSIDLDRDLRVRREDFSF